MRYITSLDPVRPDTPEYAPSEHTTSPSRRTFLGGVMTATTLGLMFSLAVPAAFSQQPETPSTTDAYRVNAGAQFTDAPPSDLSSERIGDNPRAGTRSRWAPPRSTTPPPAVRRPADSQTYAEP
jgi:hypothetical protein